MAIFSVILDLNSLQSKVTSICPAKRNKNSGEKEKELSVTDKQCQRRSWSKGSEVCEED